MVDAFVTLCGVRLGSGRLDGPFRRSVDDDAAMSARLRWDNGLGHGGGRHRSVSTARATEGGASGSGPASSGVPNNDAAAGSAKRTRMPACASS